MFKKLIKKLYIKYFTEKYTLELTCPDGLKEIQGYDLPEDSELF